MTMTLRLRLAIAAAALALLFAGCAAPALRRTSYRNVDTDSSEFKTAVAQETTRLQTAGLSPSKAEKDAEKNVTRQVVQTEKEKRTAKVAPLVRTLREFEKPRGCWAYTSTTTTHKEGKATVEIERFDPFQPESRLWTLVSRDGRVPDEREQEEYREKKLKRWKRNLARDKKRREADQAEASALLADFNVTTHDTEGNTEFTFAQGRFHLPLAGGIDWSRTSYVIDNVGGQLLSLRKAHGPAKFLATTKVDYFDAHTEFVVVDPALAPFTAKTRMRYRLHFFGVDHGDIEIETTYSDYRRVKCYDDRFEVQIGLPQVQDFLPAR